MNDTHMTEFRETIWNYYRDNSRSMPWRDDPSAYRVLVSEFMLQQTQVGRVVIKFEEFMANWPDWNHLAEATQTDVVRAWKGLGYNRRALWLHAVAERVMTEFSGELPSGEAELVSFRGIGPNTAGAVRAYAFNLPVIFIETNIRRVFIHHFFPEEEAVHDRDILPLVTHALDYEHPREWYWALMDYGTYLATQVVNPNRRSRHYVRQSAFAGSQRQLRGKILEHLLKEESKQTDLHNAFQGFSPNEVVLALESLEKDGFLAVRQGNYYMA